VNRKTWDQLLGEDNFLVLPSVYDALTARLAFRAGYPAVQVGVFALAGAQQALPDTGLVDAGDVETTVRHVVTATGLPVMVDAEDGYGPPACAAHTVNRYERAGASAVFVEDQAPPKKCGHMEGHRVVPASKMVDKLKAVLGNLLDPDTFVMARTDSYESEGLDGVLRRGEKYIKAGAHAFYVEGLPDVPSIRKVGAAFRGAYLALSVLEGGGKTPFLRHADYREMGFSMALYPTTLLFRACQAVLLGLKDLSRGAPTPDSVGLSLSAFEDLLNFRRWECIAEGHG
jgi:2-methylisocitrate lyase-like PEP mutase family enzyme